MLFAAPVVAKVFATVDAALQRAFPGCEVSARTAYLSAAQLERARGLSGGEVESALVRYHVAYKNGVLVGTAYFDAHRVRTLPQTLMIVVDPAERVRQLEILSFNEPEEYIPKGVWYEQLRSRALDDELALGRGIDGVTGATLTARATTQAARRVLALHRVLQEGEPP
ncbi:MAG: FMN-binding protein [Thermoanaerobaculia bacterium]|nr:FMN-binding protein [Thermoanaerobaculia bacterium]